MNVQALNRTDWHTGFSINILNSVNAKVKHSLKIKNQNNTNLLYSQMPHKQMLKWHILRKYNDNIKVNTYLKRIRYGAALIRRQRHLIPVATHNLGIGIGTRTPFKVARKLALNVCRTHPARR